jgi:hypothetical protein
MFALCLKMLATISYGSVVVVSRGLYIILSFWSLDLWIEETRRPSGACRSAMSPDMEWCVILKNFLGTASKSGLIRWVVEVVRWGFHPHGRGGDLGVLFSFPF